MTYEVEIGERETRVPGKFPKDVVINDLRSAVGIIIYDADSKRSFSIHLTSPNIHETDELDELLSEPASEFEASESVIVMATGACIGAELTPAEALETRSHVDQRLGTFFPRATTNILWPPDGVESTSVTLDPQTGEFRFEHAPSS